MISRVKFHYEVYFQCVAQTCQSSSSGHSQPGCIALYLVLDTQRGKSNTERNVILLDSGLG